MIDSEAQKQSEAAYYATLGTLDDLPSYEAKMLAIMNWAKYVMLLEARDKTPAGAGLLPVFTQLCSDFALAVSDLPDIYAKVHRTSFCGNCPACAARAKRQQQTAS